MQPPKTYDLPDGLETKYVERAQTKNRFLHGVVPHFQQLLLGSAIVLFLVPFVGLMFCASLADDDFAKATLAIPGYICVNQQHVFTAAFSEYRTGSGRWMANLLESSAMSTVNLSWGYGWLLLLVMLSNLAALAYFFQQFFRVPVSRGVLAAGIFYAAWLASLYFVGENLFWLTSAMEYQLPITTLLMLAGLLCKPRPSRIHFVLMGLLAVAIPAQHEAAGVFLVVVLFGGVLAARLLRMPQYHWLVYLVLAALSVAAVLHSPGIFSRLVHAHSAPGYAGRIAPHAKRTLVEAFGWLRNPAMLLAVVCIPLVLWPSEEIGGKYRPALWLAVAGVAAMCAALAELASAEMSAGVGEFSPRVVGWFEFIFCLLFVCALAIVASHMPSFWVPAGARIGIFAIFAVSLFLSVNFHHAESDLRRLGRAWHESNLVRLARSGPVVQFGALPPRPQMFIETGLSKNTGCWVNQCLAVYLGAQQVVLAGPSENHWGGGNPCSEPASK